MLRLAPGRWESREHVTWIAVTAVAAIVAVAVHRITKEIRMTQQDTVDQITEQLGKVSGEILGKIAELEAAVAAGEPADFTALKAAVDSLDAIVPDPVVEPEPTPEVPAEPVEDTVDE